MQDKGSSKLPLIRGVMLGGFALVVTAAIALTHRATSERIEEQRATTLKNTLATVLQDVPYDNRVHRDCVVDPQMPALGIERVYRARQGGDTGAVSALLVVSTTPKGYSGDIQQLTGVRVKLLDREILAGESAFPVTVTGTRVLNHKETPGLGDKINVDVSDWILGFAGQQIVEAEDPRWSVKKDGGQFDQFTGATITPRAVIQEIRRTAVWAAQNTQWLVDADNACSQGENS